MPLARTVCFIAGVGLRPRHTRANQIAARVWPEEALGEDLAAGTACGILGLA